VLIFDGDCTFCRSWVARWQQATGDRVEYAPSQDVAERFPEIPRERFKEDAREVATGYECGLSLDGFQDVKAGDVVEAYEVEQVARRLGPTASKGQPAASA